MFNNGLSRRSLFAGLSALFLLVVFIVVNEQRSYQDSHKILHQFEGIEREQIPENINLQAKQIAFHDFESGNAADPASHLAPSGHDSRQSFEMSQQVQFSPGLWIKFKDLKPPDSSWIRATGYIWFSCPPAGAKCSLVATCNHKGVNYKYMFVPFETENLKPNQWNRVSIDYRIPKAPDGEDVLQAYFWYRGNGVMLVDDIEVKFFTNKKK